MSDHRAHEYTQGICQDGAAILKDGELMTIEQILQDLRTGQAARARGLEATAWIAKCPGSSVLFFEERAARRYAKVHKDRAKALYTSPSASVPDGWDLSGEPGGYIRLTEIRSDLSILVPPYYERGNLWMQVVGRFLNAISSAHTTPQRVDNWIKCSERLPSTGAWVSGLTNTERVIPAILINNGDSAYFRTAGDELSEGTIVAWKPLPNPPAQGA